MSLAQSPPSPSLVSVERPRPGRVRRWLGRIAYLAGAVAVADFPPTDQHREVHDVLRGRLASAKEELQRLLDNDLPAFNRRLEENGLPRVVAGME